ncbi:MAG: M48 family metallopeptidase [candidate division NC10 bacterium]|nr:M48 family metallopeptidase [candidate division NC10 bacterium]
MSQASVSPSYRQMKARRVLALLLLFGSLTVIPMVAPSIPTSPAWAAASPANLPPEVVTYFTPEDVARGRAYTGGRYRLFAGGTALRLAILLLLVGTPASAALRTLAVRLAPARPAVAVAIYIGLLVALFELLTLPLGYYAGFVREHAFGLSTQTRAAWLLDRAKGALITLVLAVPLGSLLALLWRRYPGRWVLPAWGLSGLAMILLVALAPIVIDPLFNTIRPLADPDLRQRVIALAGRAGIPVDQVYEMDASRRTRKGNAYFTGLGHTKRIVLYDTLLTTGGPDEVELVVAHEIGHWTRSHIWKGIGLSILGIGIALWCGARVLDWAARRGGFHLAGPADVAGLPLVLLVLFVLSLLGLPLQNAISRRFEREADRTSLELTGNAAAFIRSEVQLARSNLADLTPPPLVVWLLYTHPPVPERIRMAEQSAGETRPRP